MTSSLSCELTVLERALGEVRWVQLPDCLLTDMLLSWEIAEAEGDLASLMGDDAVEVAFRFAIILGPSKKLPG